jgi:hypothetical protein
MLPVEAIALSGVGPTLVRPELVGVCWCAVGHIGIHVPHGIVRLAIGGGEGGPEFTVGQYVMTVDDPVKCSTQVLAITASGRIVITGRWLGHQPIRKQGYDGCEEEYPGRGEVHGRQR